jgi:hypothetical protein
VLHEKVDEARWQEAKQHVTRQVKLAQLKHFTTRRSPSSRFKSPSSSLISFLNRSSKDPAFASSSRLLPFARLPLRPSYQYCTAKDQLSPSTHVAKQTNYDLSKLFCFHSLGRHLPPKLIIHLIKLITFDSLNHFEVEF